MRTHARAVVSGGGVNGDLWLLRNRDRMDAYRNDRCAAETIGVACYLIGVDEIKTL